MGNNARVTKDPIFDKVIRERLSKKVTFKQRPKSKG